MHDIDLILTLTGGLAAALVCGYVTFRLGLSPIVGYLLAGFVVGPHTPGFVADRELAEQLAEVGIILLMFGVGLQFHLEELLAVRKVAVPGALAASLIATLLGAAVGLAAGWSLSAGVVFGLAISVASTVVLLRVLADAGDLHTRAGHVAVGWLVVEDLLTVFVLVLLPAVFGRGGATAGGPAGHPLLAVMLAVVKVGALVVLTLYGGGRLIPWLLARVAATRSRELFTLTVLVVALGIAVGSAKVFGVSMAAGRLPRRDGRGAVRVQPAGRERGAADARRVRRAVLRLGRDAVRPPSPDAVAGPRGRHAGRDPAGQAAWRRWPSCGCSASRCARRPRSPSRWPRSASSRSSSPPPAGRWGSSTTRPSTRSSPRPSSRSPSTRCTTGWRGRSRPSSGGSSRNLRCRGPQDPGSSTGPALDDDPDRDRVVVVGCGPMGRTLVRLLRENQFQPVVIELNLQTVRELAGEGIAAVYGDAVHRQTLEQAGLRDARRP